MPCVYTGNRVSSLVAVESAVGYQYSCALVFNESAPTWTGLENPWFLSDERPMYDWHRWVSSGPRQLIISQEMIPDEAPSDWRLQGAKGAYNSHWIAFARYLIASGAGNAVIRLAPEMNGDWNKDNVGDTSLQYGQWAGYWRQIVMTMRQVPGSHFRFDWNVNSGYRTIPFAQYYPGDEYVDIIGIDQYDTAPGPETDPQTRWSRLYDAPGGLASLVSFANTHEKPVSFPEWGLYTSAYGGGGDDPYYVKQMFSLFQTLTRTAYESAWFAPTPGCVDLSAAPQSLTAYRAALQ